MRHERQPKNKLTLSLEIVSAGVGQTGLAATTFFVLQRLNDSLYYNRGTGTWDAAPPPANLLDEVHATRFPGLYEFEVPTVDLTNNLAEDGYRFLVAETTTPVQEMGRIDVGPVLGGEWEELLADHYPPPSSTSMADALGRVLALRQQNVRFVPSAWDAVSKQPTAGLVLIYGSKADLLADTGPGWALAIGKYTITGAFSGIGELTAYTSVKDL